MTELEKIQRQALDKLLYRLMWSHASYVHGNPKDIHSEGRYYTTLTFRTTDIESEIKRTRSALRGELPEDTEIGILCAERDEIERKIEAAQKARQLAYEQLNAVEPKAEAE